MNLSMIVGILLVLGVIVSWIWAIITTFSVVWGASFGWLYFLILIGLIVLFATFKMLSVKKNWLTDEQLAELKIARNKIFEERAKHEQEIYKRLGKRRNELESKNSSKKVKLVD